jgi:hypothetical protein
MLKRSPFRPKKAPAARPAREWGGDAMPGPRSALERVPAASVAHVAIPKRVYVRSAKLMKAYRELPCQWDDCGRADGTVCGAHANWSIFGKGGQIKADDSRAASLCAIHHHELDQGHRYTEAGKQRMWWRAHVKTIDRLIVTGLWPASVPVPSIEYPEEWS